jgi:hypothetical protein
MTTEKHDPWALLAEIHELQPWLSQDADLAARVDAALAEVERLTAERNTAMDRMQQAIIDLLNEHNAPLHLIARIVEMEYP